MSESIKAQELMEQAIFWLRSIDGRLHELLQLQARTAELTHGPRCGRCGGQHETHMHGAGPNYVG